MYRYFLNCFDFNSFLWYALSQRDRGMVPRQAHNLKVLVRLQLPLPVHTDTPLLRGVCVIHNEIL